MATSGPTDSAAKLRRAAAEVIGVAPSLGERGQILSRDDHDENRRFGTEALVVLR